MEPERGMIHGAQDGCFTPPIGDGSCGVGKRKHVLMHLPISRRSPFYSLDNDKYCFFIRRYEQSRELP